MTDVGVEDIMVSRERRSRARPDSYFKRTRAVCPVCNALARVRTSEDMTPVTRRIYYDCSNDACGMRFSALLSVERVITPSMMDPAFVGLTKPGKPPG